MRVPWILISILVLLQLAIDIYLFRIAMSRTRKDRWPRIQASTAIFFLIYLIVTLCLPRRTGNDETLAAVMWLLFGYITVYMSKTLFVIIDLIASVPKLWHRKRIKALSWIGTAIAIALFGSLWWGALINRFRIQINEVTLEIENLPASFDGFRIVQFSDIHVGSYGSDTSFISKVVNEINALKPDAVFFTGDIVNRRTAELLPFTKTLSGIKAADGVYSILGNHDYGDYSDWPSPQDKADNMMLMEKLQRNMGWQLLRNATTWIHLVNDSISVIGVENWGEPPFPTYGNLHEAYPDTSDKNVKILLTHNPVHWIADVENNISANIALTLSGHTHAMQIEALGISPAAIRYKTWGGRYDSPDKKRTLYVNIGMGTVGIPMRLGATPELTLITLRSK
ncbi:MAG: metallophosphoesterase [Muribaculaceae bacterium]|nr:metallophosphoesterase [Muribaculaceae bacterium]